MNKLEWSGSHYLEVTLDEEGVRLRKVEVDPFAEAMKQPDSAEFDRILSQQRQSQEDAFKAFEAKVKDPPEVLPEDKPDHWR